MFGAIIATLSPGLIRDQIKAYARFCILCALDVVDIAIQVN